MKLLSALRGQLQEIEAKRLGGASRFQTGMAAIDALLPEGSFALGAVHEILAHQSVPRFFALLLARSASRDGVVVWSDPHGDVYPPALVAHGLPLDRLLFLRAENPADELWGVAECLACQGVAATIAAPVRLTRIDARRLQLAAERGGGIGVLLRPTGAAHYAAATRWLVTPAHGDESVQRWNVEIVHGGHIGKSVTVEVCRDSNHVRALDRVADRSSPAATARASA